MTELEYCFFSGHPEFKACPEASKGRTSKVYTMYTSTGLSSKGGLSMTVKGARQHCLYLVANIGEFPHCHQPFISKNFWIKSQYDSFVVKQNFILRINSCGKSRQLLLVAKPHQQAKKTILQRIITLFDAHNATNICYCNE